LKFTFLLNCHLVPSLFKVCLAHLIFPKFLPPGILGHSPSYGFSFVHPSHFLAAKPSPSVQIPPPGRVGSPDWLLFAIIALFSSLCKKCVWSAFPPPSFSVPNTPAQSFEILFYAFLESLVDESSSAYSDCSFVILYNSRFLAFAGCIGQLTGQFTPSCSSSNPVLFPFSFSEGRYFIPPPGSIVQSSPNVGFPFSPSKMFLSFPASKCFSFPQ